MDGDQHVREQPVTVTLRPISLTSILLVCGHLPRAEQEVIEALNGVAFDSDDVARQAANYPGLAWTIEAEGFPIVVGGFIPQRPGVYRTWFYATTDAWERFGRPVTKLVRQVLHQMLVEQAHRVEVVTLADRARTHWWYEVLGLHREALLEGYGASGQDAVLYVALKPEAT
jgi:hypothetical protein